MHILRSSNYRRMPWKNGGGETREILVSPPGATLDSLHWRVSLATVASDGPFSIFPGVLRTLCVIRGAGIRLQVGNAPAQTLFEGSEPCTFEGQTPTSAFLVDGPIVDLNVMSRRGHYRHAVQRMAFTGSRELQLKAFMTIVLCRRGSVSCVGGGQSGQLEPEDCAVVDEDSPSISLHTTADAEILVIEIDRQSAAEIS